MKKAFFLSLGILSMLLTSCGNAAPPISSELSPGTSETSSMSATGSSGSQMDAQHQLTEEPESETDAGGKTPDPVVYTGTGDDVIQIDPPDGTYVFHISGNDEGRHFSVTAYDNYADYLALLVNTSDPYIGTTYDNTQSAAILEIKATGDWTIELISIFTTDALISGNTISGEGDAVLQVFQPVLTADVAGNEAGRHFAIKSYGTSGEYLDLLVNATDPYEGTVMLGLEASILAITATGPWSVTAG